MVSLNDLRMLWEELEVRPEQVENDRLFFAKVVSALTDRDARIAELEAKLAEMGGCGDG
jgi:hypothetical protein